MRPRGLVLVAMTALFGSELAAADQPFQQCGPLSIRDLAPVSGIDFVHDRGTSGEKHLVETMGGGVAWLDYDGDGWQDLYLVQSGPFPPDGSEAAGNRLYRNLGNGRFEDVTSRSGTGDRGCGQGATAADVDGDGDLDLYVTRYVEYDPDAAIFCGDSQTGKRRYCDPSIYVGAGDRFYRNVERTRFVDASESAGILPADGRGLGVVFTDFDGDGRPDLYVANDLNINLLFRNRGDATFEDLSLISGVGVNREGRPEAGMGLAVGDVNGDLLPDLAVTNFDVETNTLYRNLGEMAFEDVSASSGFGLPSFNQLAFGVAMVDLDRDGDLDFYVANGHIFETPNRENVSYQQRDQVLLGDGTGRFRELRCAALDDRFTAARGLAIADLDNDGDVEVAVQENGGPFGLLDTGEIDSPWLGFELRGSAINTDGIGAQVLVTTPDGQQASWILAGDSYQSSADRRVLFAVQGTKTEVRVDVTWPAGGKQRYLASPPGRYLILFESQGP